MTKFGEWLGESNGRNMLIDISLQDVSKEQFRAALTTYCILFDIHVDTKRWDDLISDMYEFYNSWICDAEEFDLYMSELLV